MATATDTRLQAKTISPTLTVNNIQQSLKFFEGLGFGVGLGLGLGVGLGLGLGVGLGLGEGSAAGFG